MATEETVRCRCGHVFAVRAVRHVDARSPRKRELLLGSENRSECPQCGRRLDLSCPVLYEDRERKVRALIVPGGEEGWGSRGEERGSGGHGVRIFTTREEFIRFIVEIESRELPERSAAEPGEHAPAPSDLDAAGPRPAAPSNLDAAGARPAAPSDPDAAGARPAAHENGAAGAAHASPQDAVAKLEERVVSAGAARRTDAPLTIEVGLGFLTIATTELADKVRRSRTAFVREMGIPIPPVRLRENNVLPRLGWRILFRGTQVARGEERLDRDGPETIARSLVAVMRQRVSRLLGRKETLALLDELWKTNSIIVRELLPDRLSLGDVCAVLRGLLDEGIPIGDLETILEALADSVAATRDIRALTERARAALADVIGNRHAGIDGVVRACALEPFIERALQRGAVPAALEETILHRIEEAVCVMEAHGLRPAVLCAPHLRRRVRGLVRKGLPSLAVLSTDEIAAGVRIELTGTVRLSPFEKAVSWLGCALSCRMAVRPR